MLNKDGVRELCYVARVTEILPIDGADRVEIAKIQGWTCMVAKNAFKVGDLGVFFEADSKLPTKPEFEFLEKRHYKVKVQKFFKGTVISDGLLMSFDDFGWDKDKYAEGTFLTKELGVTYAEFEDNKRKGSGPDKYKKMAQRRPDIFRKSWAKWMMRRKWGRKVMFMFFGRKKDTRNWPVGKFPGVSKTDQERVENMPWVLQDKTPFIVTQKCDGSSGTYILERKNKNKFEFYVCSRNVRMENKEQECFYGAHNYYWEVAEKYDIENKMKDFLLSNPNVEWVCWQGEICAPGIQQNPHHLTSTHFYCFHWTDSFGGRLDIRNAAEVWKAYNMEVVPIISDNYIMPNDFEELKKTADGYYDKSVCEGDSTCHREGFVYYKTDNPSFSFKNVSREYLMK